MRDQKYLNCPNCGAPVTGEKCQYCGTVFYDWAGIDSNKPFYIKMKLNNKLVMFKAVMSSLDIEIKSNEDNAYYCNNIIAYFDSYQEMEIKPVFKVIPEDNILYTVMKVKGGN